jgi:hypothetical protein
VCCTLMSLQAHALFLYHLVVDIIRQLGEKFYDALDTRSLHVANIITTRSTTLGGMQ